MITASVQAADIGGEGEIVLSPKHGSHLHADAAETGLGALARRLGLSFWGHHVEGNDLIVVHPAPREQGRS